MIKADADLIIRSDRLKYLMFPKMFCFYIKLTAAALISALISYELDLLTSILLLPSLYIVQISDLRKRSNIVYIVSL